MKTGSGNPDYIVTYGPEKDLLEGLNLSVHGLPSTVDSDSVLPQTKLSKESVRQQIHHMKQEGKRAQEKHDREMKLLDLQINIKESS
ncbi:hypothetical protein JTB14_001577 [Gonioctena quinquepunctata]|nr:hypothetical protein JTB14_001577 [Gonioctena quinquepunctata]